MATDLKRFTISVTPSMEAELDSAKKERYYRGTLFRQGRKIKKGADKMTQRVTVQHAAKELGLAPQGVREYMKRGLIDIGDVLPAIQGKGKTKRYVIYREKLDRYLGKTSENGGTSHAVT